MKYSYPLYQLTQYPDGNEVKAIEVDSTLPFTIGVIEQLSLAIPYPYKIIATEDYARKFICVRTDVYPLMWRWWWFVYRIEKTAQLFKSFMVYVAQEWGLAYTQPGKLSAWKDLGKRKQN